MACSMDSQYGGHEIAQLRKLTAHVYMVGIEDVIARARRYPLFFLNLKFHPFIFTNAYAARFIYLVSICTLRALTGDSYIWYIFFRPVV